MKKANKDNPFYDNHLFSRDDLERRIFSKWNLLWLWIFPTKVSIVDGYAFHFKVINGAYWLMKIENLMAEVEVSDAD